MSRFVASAEYSFSIVSIRLSVVNGISDNDDTLRIFHIHMRINSNVSDKRVNRSSPLGSLRLVASWKEGRSDKEELEEEKVEKEQEEEEEEVVQVVVEVVGRRTTLFANYSASAHLHPRSRQPSAGGVNLLIKRNCLQ